MPVLSRASDAEHQLRPREGASESSHNVLASTLLPQREFMEATFKTT
jgi:hypothetical protein